MLLKLKNNKLEVAAGDDATLNSLTLDNDASVAETSEVTADIVILNFPTFKDGRAYTQARQLREQLGFKGDVRATGDIIRDQILYLVRCGFTSFEVSPSTDVEGLNAALVEFENFYQPAADQVLPAWMLRQQARQKPLRRSA
ncbi:MAG: DUF934 domain-containing protein [Aquisalinus sp.]|nr:DUF934 domain-containing protein [Aquisalinus sp.]